jgi:GNAT superfamily N-acetyltransferase
MDATKMEKSIGMSNAEMLDAMDRNLAEHACHLHRTTRGMSVSEVGGVLIADSGLGHDTFNIVAEARFSKVEAEQRINEVAEQIRRASRPFSWWVGPASLPVNLGERLTALGWEATESETAMYANLSAIPERELPAELTIERVVNPQQLNDFAHVLAANWDPIAEDVIRFYELVSDAALSPLCKATYFVGYVDGQPVGASEIFSEAGVVGLYGVATLSSMRRRGYGTALTLAPLHYARKQGETTAVLEAPKMVLGFTQSLVSLRVVISPSTPYPRAETEIKLRSFSYLL